jgi:hypothetical protein
MRKLLILVAVLAHGPVLGAQCSAASGEKTTALVELYTSEGCDSCPPADRWLSSLGPKGYAPDRVVPIALHVDYWDYIGWKDPFARQAHSNRQRKMAKLARVAMVYTPQVLLQGRDFRGWRSGWEFEQEVSRINARPARASIHLELDTAPPGAFRVKARAALKGTVTGEPALYLAAYENKLVSEVKAGENRGRTLPHDYVVLQWQGPLEFKATTLEEERLLPLLPKAVRAQSGVAAFVQDRSTGEVLQTLMQGACPG